MFKHLEDFKENFNKPIDNERTIRVLNMFYATVLFALIGFPVKWCALGFAGYIYMEAMRIESRIDEILKMEEIPMHEESDDEDDEISSYTKNTGMGAVGLADGRHIKFGDSDSEEEEEEDEQVEDSDSEEDSDYDPNRDSQPETDDEQEEQSEDDDSTDEFIKSVDKMFNVKVGRENVVKNPLYKKNQEEEFTMISGDDLSGNKPALGSSSCIMC